MMQYLVAAKLKSLVGDLTLSNFMMPYWNIEHPPIEADPAQAVYALEDEQRVDMQRVAYLAENRIFDRFEWHGYGQRLEYFPVKEQARALFSRPDLRVPVFDGDAVVCPVRAGEILDARHPGYTVIPVDFYADVIEDLGLRPVFTGQTEDNIYMRALKDRFPRAEIVPHHGILEDFQIIRSASNIVLSISTFAWLAAWLSHAKTIVLPVYGMFNPGLFPGHDLLPLGDDRYHFYRFPPQPAVPLRDLMAVHAAMRGQWQRVDGRELRRR
ncbi:hypothetical protein FF100_25855 [Methylobacterium terricola]|uniref:Uncharacterized protein n=1 Tax=Methylobacterium terricola TaxID=2583531 RepID=A0A5C4LC15_9HYPH|nr:hypothetical protein [Methylobacterium terricola]TNC09633.1 hypothetical protein FF100_25855 [Methylobacterium terricola]